MDVFMVGNNGLCDFNVPPENDFGGSERGIGISWADGLGFLVSSSERQYNTRMLFEWQ